MAVLIAADKRKHILVLWCNLYMKLKYINHFVVKRQAEEVGKCARQIALAGKLQAQDARAIKKARSEIKSKKTLEAIYGKLKNIKQPVNRIHFRYAALDSQEQRVARLWDRRSRPLHHGRPHRPAVLGASDLHVPCVFLPP